MPEIAIQMLMAAREFYPTNPALLIRLGHLFTATNQMDAARQCFEEVVEMCPNDIRAIKAYKDAMARDSMVKGGWTDATREGGSFRDMVKDLKESVTLEQESRAVRSRESVDLLIKDAQDNIRLQPDNINYRRTLANLFVEGGRFDDAIRTIEEARRVSGIDEGQLYQVRATIRLKQLDSAIAQLKENGDLEGAAAKQLEKDAFLFEDVRGRVERYPNDMPLRFEYGV
ncbi:MAG: hypothetical protein GX806_04070, partial [Lentisphaerae bacterium]|nr:hypothetical protein [Lentisphaerota bacterium]